MCGSIGGNSSGYIRDRSGVKCVFIINFLFLLVLFFRGSGGLGARKWGIGVSGAIILVRSIGGVRGSGAVDFNFIINLIFLLFLVIHVFGGVKG